VRYTYLQFVGMATFAVVVSLVMPLLAEHVLGPSFAESARYVRWFAIAFACSGMYYMVASYIFYAERTIWLAAVTFVSAVVNIPLNYLLITRNGAIGAAQATACAMALSFLLTWLVSSRVYAMPWRRPFPRRA
jgi:O-antigen/teichoic acid export membrane protein